MKKLKYFFSILGGLLIILNFYIFGSVIYASTQDKIPIVFNHAYSIVVTSSMEPTIKTNEFVLTKKVDISKVKVGEDGDVITFICINPDLEIYNKPVTHRAVRKEVIDGEIFIYTKGDNILSSEDEYKVSSSNLIGVVTYHSESLGKFLIAFSNSKNILFAFSFVIIFGNIILVAARGFIEAKKEYLEEKRKEDEANLRLELKAQLLKEMEEASNEEK